MGKGITCTKIRRILNLICSVCFILMLAGNVSAQRRIPGDFIPGDAVRIITWQSPLAKGSVENLGITDDYVIDRRGRIFLPLVGYIQAVGLSREALADSLESHYRKFASGLSFVCKPLMRITVLGAINKPGSYIVEPSASLWHVINEAGGPKTGADFQKMYYMRNGQVIAENLLTQFERAYSVEEIGIKSGDQLYLPARTSFRVRTLFEYVSFLSSIVILYFTIEDRVNR